MDLDSIADELYALPREEFTAARNSAAAQAKAAGDRELAAQVNALRKPTMAAWLVNQLARRRADELRPLIDLGRELRDARSALTGDDLRELTRQRHRVVHALVQQARALSPQRVGESVAEEVRQTLDASLADPAVAEEVLTGRLVQARSYAGFGEPGLASGGQQAVSRRQTARAPSRAGGESPVSDLDARRRARAERAVQQATQQLAAAKADVDQLHEEQRASQAAHRQADSAAERARAELKEADARLRAAAEKMDGIGRRLDAAQASLRRAEHKRDEAQSHLDALS